MVSFLLNLHKDSWVIRNRTIRCFVIMFVLIQLLYRDLSKRFIKINGPQSLASLTANSNSRFKIRVRKTKTIQKHLGIFTYIPVYSTHSRIIMHNSAYLGITQYIQGYSELWYIQNLGIFRALAYSGPGAYSEPWHMQNPCIFQSPFIFRTRAILRSLAYTEPKAYADL